LRIVCRSVKGALRCLDLAIDKKEKS
jgi:hypothetical protein